MIKKLLSLMIASIGASAAISIAAPTTSEIEKLGKSLTPVGAEMVGNKDGSIPAWAGATNKPTGQWTPGKNRPEFSAFKTEKALFTIDASNVDRYADKLSPGQIAMLKQVKGFKMNVYPSHRQCSYPDFVLNNTRAGAPKAAIGDDGWSLKEAALPSVPFPIPKSGIEAMWNYLMRYQGVGYSIEHGISTVSPAPGSTNGIFTAWASFAYFPWGKKGTTFPADVKNIQQGYYYGYREPAALAGQALVQTYFLNKDAESFYYFTGQRRVRRLPNYSYDTPVIGFENQLPNDALSLFYGNPDRFDWKLLGKKEMYIGYNNLDIVNPQVKAQGLDQPFIDNEIRRYELHRVWVVEATVKSGARHSSPKKTFYLDEDTWLVVSSEDYDIQGKLWRQKEAAVYPAWEIGACTNTGLYYLHDFSNGRYVTDNNVTGGKSQIRFFLNSDDDKRLTTEFFTAESLRTISER